MDLIEQIHLPPPGGAERDLLEQLTNVLDPVVRCRIKLVQIEATTSLDRLAGVALSTWLAVGEVVAVQRLRKNTGSRCFASSAGTAE